MSTTTQEQFREGPSTSRARWLFRNPVPETFAASFPEHSAVMLQLLQARGLEKQTQIDEFLQPDYSSDVHDPFLFRDMHKAVDRIIDGVKKSERIVVYGDYDADGVCGASVLWTTLQALGANPGVYLPDRQSEGYGLNEKAVESLHSQGYTLIITVDCGVTSVPEVKKANELGIDVIITDHHSEPPELPAAYAILNPKLAQETYPFRELAGTAVGFKLAHALLLKSEYGKSFDREPLVQGWEKWLLDLVAIATVADMMPMLGENRTLTMYGLKVLQKTRRLGLRSLFSVMRSDLKKADTETIGFMIAPRLNAAGRLDHANTAFRLLVTEDAAEALALADDLERTNTARQAETERIVDAAIEQIGSEPEQPIVGAYHPDWQVGVLGLAAGRLVHRYGRPAIVMAKVRGLVTGSGRSIPALNLMEALDPLRSNFEKFGGHPQACGFTLKTNYTPEEFVTDFAARAGELLKGRELAPELLIDAELALHDVNWDLLEQIEQLAPFGQNARRPIFAVRDVQVVEARQVGKKNQHLSLTIRSAQGTEHRSIGFTWGEEHSKLPVGKNIDLAFELSADEWNGERRLQLKILDIHYSDETDNTSI